MMTWTHRCRSSKRNVNWPLVVAYTMNDNAVVELAFGCVVCVSKRHAYAVVHDEHGIPLVSLILTCGYEPAVARLIISIHVHAVNL